MEPDYLAVLYQWLFFFAIVGILLYPAFSLRRIAKQNGKKGWLFFLVGLAIGFGIMVLNRFIGFFMMTLGLQKDFSEYLWIPFLIIGYGLGFLATQGLSRWIRKPEDQIPHDVIDHDVFKQ